MKNIFLFLLISIFTFSALAADGDLDISFGTSGKVLTNSTTSDYMERLAIQTNGKIIAVGYSAASRTSFTFSCLVVRYNADGSVDSTFGTNGRFTFSPTSDSCQLNDVAIQADGKLIATGLSNNNKIFIVRLNQNGTLDTTFDGDGYNNAVTGFANSIEIERSTGKIVVGGAILSTTGGTHYDFAMVRFNPSGALDTSFDGDGVVTTFIGTASIANAEGVTDFKITADGKYTGVGTTSNATAVQNLTIVRYNNNGSLDTSFGGTGYVVKTIASSNSTGQAIDVQADGKIVTVGSSNTASRTVARFNADGSIDANFGANGFAFTAAGGDNFFELVVQTDGKILTAGRKLQATATGLDFYLFRLNPNGSADTGFGTGGVIFTNFGTGNTDQAKSILLQADGKILVGGISYVESSPVTTPYIFALARYQNSAAAPPVNNPALRIADFDGDGRTDASVFRSGTWFINPSLASNFAPAAAYSVQFGLAADKLAPADYDGDGKTDIAVWRESEGNFYVLNSANNSVRIENFGLAGDQLTVGDYDGDGKADLSVYRDGAQSFFFYRGSLNNPSGNITYLPWGVSGDKAVRGDFDGDRKMDAAVFRASDRTWYIRQSSDNQVIYRQFGLADDRRVSGDFDGDGKTDVGVVRDGTWYILQSSNNQIRYVNWGLNSDTIAAGDYDGDGKTDVAVWRSGVYYVLNSANQAVSYQYFGSANDSVVAAAFVQ